MDNDGGGNNGNPRQSGGGQTQQQQSGGYQQGNQQAGGSQQQNAGYSQNGQNGSMPQAQETDREDSNAQQSDRSAVGGSGDNPAQQTEGSKSNESQMSQEEKKEKHKQDLLDTADIIQDYLFKATSVFPFDLVPNTISVSRMKIAITKRDFFKVSEVMSVLIDDVLNVEANSGPFFGSIKIYTKIYGNDPQVVHWLPRDATVEFKRIVEGLIIAKKQGINVMEFEKGECRMLLMRLGSDAKLT